MLQSFFLIWIVTTSILSLQQSRLKVIFLFLLAAWGARSSPIVVHSAPLTSFSALLRKKIHETTITIWLWHTKDIPDIAGRMDFIDDAFRLYSCYVKNGFSIFLIYVPKSKILGSSWAALYSFHLNVSLRLNLKRKIPQWSKRWNSTNSDDKE